MRYFFGHYHHYRTITRLVAGRSFREREVVEVVEVVEASGAAMSRRVRRDLFDTFFTPTPPPFAIGLSTGAPGFFDATGSP